MNKLKRLWQKMWDKWDNWNFKFVFAVACVLILGFILAWGASCKQASIFNRLNRTSYTCSDMFWVGQNIQINK